MLRFRLFGFPVFIHWSFWLTVAIFGGAFERANDPDGMRQLLAWVFVALVSILIHELGHAFVMRHFGDPRAFITLHSFGGLATGSRRLTRQQSFYITLAGPAAQLTAGVLAWNLVDLVPGMTGLGKIMADSFVRISIFWALVNLVPIIPLDGGHIALALLGPQRQRTALLISLVSAGLMLFLALTNGFVFGAIIVGMMAFNNIRSLRGEPIQPFLGAS